MLKVEKANPLKRRRVSVQLAPLKASRATHVTTLFEPATELPPDELAPETGAKICEVVEPPSVGAGAV